MTLLSPHLTEAEFLATMHRDLWDEQLEAWPGARENALRFARNVFEPIRQLLGPLHVTSGFRCPRLNAAVGGRLNSRHLLGLAIDVVPFQISLHEGLRRVVAALLGAGAIALADDLIGSVTSGGILSKLSRRFGEGVVNGALTARVGLAAMELSRPLPFHALPKPGTSATTTRALAGLFGRAETEAR